MRWMALGMDLLFHLIANGCFCLWKRIGSLGEVHRWVFQRHENRQMHSVSNIEAEFFMPLGKNSY